MCIAFMFGHTLRIYSALLSDELCSSPASMRKGLLLTMSWLEVLVLRRCGMPEELITEVTKGVLISMVYTILEVSWFITIAV
jgi:hypothetical protein